MSREILKNNRKDTVELFKTMEFSEIKISHSKLAQLWLKEHDNYVAGFVNGKWETVIEPSTQEHKIIQHSFTDCSVTYKDASPKDLNLAVRNVSKGFKEWHQFDEVKRSNILFRISQCLEQQNKLLSGIENLSKSGRMREKNYLQYLIDSFKYYSSLVGCKNLHKEWKSIGVVCVISDDKAPISCLWHISVLLAAGNAILYLVDSPSNLSSFILAEICHACGVPAGAFNVVFSQSSFPTEFSSIDQFILSPSKMQIISSENLFRCIPCEILPCKWPNMVIYDSADLDAAMNSIFEILNITDKEEPWPLNKIYLQESILKNFIDLISRKISSDCDRNLNQKPPFYIMGSEALIEQLEEYLEYDLKEMFLQKNTDRCGAGIYIELFRTVKESIAMFNTDKRGPDVSLWTEEMHLALEAAHKFKTKTVWINCINLYDPSVASGSLYLNGSSVVGGIEGLFSHISLGERLVDCRKDTDFLSYGSATPESKIVPIITKEEKITKTYKLFIGGAFVNSSDDTFQTTLTSEKKPYAMIASAIKSDVDKAISSASSSQPKWESSSKLSRSAVFRKASETLKKRKEEFVVDLCVVTGRSKEVCSKEVESAISLLTYWSNFIAHNNNATVETKPNYKVFEERYPFGVIGIQSPNNEPFLSFVFLVSPAIIFRNSVVAIASEKYPTCALMMCEVFQSAGLPGGVLNVLTNSRSYLTRHLTSHLSIDTIWFCEDGENFIYNSYHSVQPKKIFNCKNMANDFDDAKKLKFKYESTYSKAIFMPMGTGFA